MLRGASGYLRALLETTTDAVAILDADGRALLCNAEYERRFGEGVELEDENGQPLLPEETPFARATSGESFTVHFTAPPRIARPEEGLESHPEGRAWFEAVARPLPPGSRARGSVLVIRDITDRRLKELQAQMFAMAAHELRTPVTALHNFLHVVAGGLRPDATESVRISADMALQLTERLSLLVRDVLEAGRAQSGRLRLSDDVVDMAALVERACAVARSFAGETAIEVSVAPGPMLARGDATRLEQVLLNLLDNAVQHGTPEGTDACHVRVEVRRWDGQVHVSVRDEGPGIPKAELPHVFSRFTRGNRQGGLGLGLGLYVAREIVTAHGGAILVSSEEGVGSTFTVSLPLAVPVAPRAAAGATHAPAAA